MQHIHLLSNVGGNYIYLLNKAGNEAVELRGSDLSSIRQGGKSRNSFTRF